MPFLARFGFLLPTLFFELRYLFLLFIAPCSFLLLFVARRWSFRFFIALKPGFHLDFLCLLLPVVVALSWFFIARDVNHLP